jgi:nitronate monooxygenase
VADLRTLLPGPVVVAPMGGGPTTVALVVATARAGALPFLAAGYQSAGALAEQLDAVRDAGVAPFGVNVFVPGRPTADRTGLARHLDAIAAEAGALGVGLGSSTWDDDDWDAKVALLLDRAPPVVSTTFGLPPPTVVAALQLRGTVVVATVTSVAEADAALTLGVDALCAQGIEAGAHRGTFSDPGGEVTGPGVVELVRAIRARTDVAVLAAGGITTPDAVGAARAAGADAVQCGTAFLRCDESGTHPTYRAALVDPRFAATAFTRAFSGRPARGLVNAFLREHPDAPAAYPEVNGATRPMRAAAAAAGDPDRMSLWAGTGWRDATGGPAADVVAHLASGW